MTAGRPFFSRGLLFFWTRVALGLSLFAGAQASETAPAGGVGTVVASSASASSVVPLTRVARIFLSEHLLNSLLKQNVKSPYVQDLSMRLDPEQEFIRAQGLLKIPPEDLKAVNLEPGMTDFRFQLTIKPKTTRHGHLILVFPFNETFFYPATSTDPQKDRIVVPMQVLSLALASARGYLSILSGDFSGFDRDSHDLQLQMAAIDAQLAATKDPDERESLQIDRKNIENKQAAIPLERKKAEQLAKKVQSMFGFVGEKEINFNDELVVHHNALVLRVRLSQLVPYLEGIELGALRILTDERDGSGEHFMAIDVNAPIPGYEVAESTPSKKSTGVRRLQAPPEIVIRFNQALLESPVVLDAEKEGLGKRVHHFSLDFERDGIHARGGWHIPFLPDVPFDAIIDMTWVAPNVFDIRVREIKVLAVDLKLLTGLVLESAKKRLDSALKGVCTFQYIGKEKDNSRAVRVTTNMAALLPAFPKMVLSGIRVKEREFILKASAPPEGH